MIGSSPQTHVIIYGQEICDSQEAWWLRKGCQRARCRLLKGLADAFEIPVRSVQVPPAQSDLGRMGT
jgi:hypothetical protein